MAVPSTVLTDGQTGEFDALKTDTVDANGEPLSWTLKYIDNGFTKTEYWEAIGSKGDDNVYQIIPDVEVTLKTARVSVQTKEVTP